MLRALAITAVLLGGAATQADAGHGHSHSHRQNYRYNNSSYYRGGFNGGFVSPGFGGGYGRGHYHDTSHYDYHPTEVYRHRNHYHVVPGHYDYHQTGHWHW
jgi:hypothetical protein